MSHRREPPRTAELVVIGGGVVGAATAWHAARAGLRPVLIESRPALCTLTTPVAAGAFRLQFETEREFRLVSESVELFLDFEQATGQQGYDLGVRQQGYLWATTSEEGCERQRKVVADQHGWGLRDVELLDAVSVRQRFPHVGRNVLQARFRGGDGFIDTKRLTLGLAAASRAAVVVECKAVGFSVSGGRLTGVETTRGTIAADTAVIAAGPLSGSLAETVGLHLPITTVRRQKVILPSVPQVPRDAPMTIDEDTGVHWRPALDGAWLLHTDPTTAPSPPTEDVPTDHRFAFSLLDPASPFAVARIVPFWRDVWERGDAHWILQAGQYTMTPDHRPLIGPSEIGGLFVNTGYSGHGIMGSPAGSRILVDVLAGKMSADENPFRLDRAFERREPSVL